MKYRFPQQYAEITQKLNETEASRQEFISKFNAPIIAGSTATTSTTKSRGG